MSTITLLPKRPWVVYQFVAFQSRSRLMSSTHGAPRPAGSGSVGRQPTSRAAAAGSSWLGDGRRAWQTALMCFICSCYP